MISGEEFERRLRIVSQLRHVGILLRQAALRAYEAGESLYKPRIDIRSDIEYWRARAEERRKVFPSRRNGHS